MISDSDTFNLCRNRGKPVSHSFTGLSQADGMVTVRNGSNGLKNLRITVNGRRFHVDDLQDRQGPVLLDVSSAMAAAESSTIVFTALGKPGTCAWVGVER